jgi:hypothetical protein
MKEMQMILMRVPKIIINHIGYKLIYPNKTLNQETYNNNNKKINSNYKMAIFRNNKKIKCIRICIFK